MPDRRSGQTALLTIVREYAPDPARAAAALTALLVVPSRRADEDQQADEAAR